MRPLIHDWALGRGERHIGCRVIKMKGEDEGHWIWGRGMSERMESGLTMNHV